MVDGLLVLAFGLLALALALALMVLSGFFGYELSEQEYSFVNGIKLLLILHW
jgi:hypothetical protein